MQLFKSDIMYYESIFIKWKSTQILSESHT